MVRSNELKLGREIGWALWSFVPGEHGAPAARNG